MLKDFQKLSKEKRQYEEMVSENILFTEQNANYKNENEQFDHYKEDFDNLTKWEDVSKASIKVCQNTIFLKQKYKKCFVNLLFITE